MLAWTTIYHVFRRHYKLTLNEYAFCDMVHHLSTNKTNPHFGWCWMSRENLAKELDFSKQTIMSLQKKMIAAGFVKVDTVSKWLTTTSKWNPKDTNFADFTDGKESLPTVKKVITDGKESLPGDGKESLPNIYKEDINNNNPPEEKSGEGVLSLNFSKNEKINLTDEHENLQTELADLKKDLNVPIEAKKSSAKKSIPSLDKIYDLILNEFNAVYLACFGGNEYKPTKKDYAGIKAMYEDHKERTPGVELGTSLKCFNSYYKRIVNLESDYLLGQFTPAFAYYEKQRIEREFKKAEKKTWLTHTQMQTAATRKNNPVKWDDYKRVEVDSGVMYQPKQKGVAQ